MKNNLRRGSGVELWNNIFLIGIKFPTFDCGEGEKEGLQKGGISAGKWVEK